jgi:prepilin-type N-terminal cleavage/methylation domain-containing protein
MQHSYKKGFTLIELLVVIAIIGILASIVLASLDSSRKKGRDARRLSDIKQIQLALELYYDQNNSFPPNVSSSNTFDPAVLTGPGYISVVPVDPTTGTAYKYTAYASTAAGQSAVCTNYHLGTGLESANHNALQTDVDISTNNPANGSVKPPPGWQICTAGSPPANDFDGWATGKDCTGTIGTAVTASSGGTEECYDVKP